MTAAERLRREGREEGEKEGRKEGHKEGSKEGSKNTGQKYLIAMLQGRFGALPEAVLAAIRAAENPQLDRWFERGLLARSLDDVFSDAA